MYDIERVIAKRIDLAKKYINPLNNPALVRHHEIEIKTLQTAPRIEAELLKAIQKKKPQIDKIKSCIEDQPLRDELKALEWLLPVVKSKNDPTLTENSFV